MAVAANPLDRLEREQRNRPMRSAVDVVVLMLVAVQAQAPDTRLLNRRLRHTARRDVDLDDAAVDVHHIRNTPKRVSGIGAWSAASIPRDSTRRVSSGSMTPSSQRRAVAKYGEPSRS